MDNVGRKTPGSCFQPFRGERIKGENSRDAAEFSEMTLNPPDSNRISDRRMKIKWSYYGDSQQLAPDGMVLKPGCSRPSLLLM